MAYYSTNDKGYKVSLKEAVLKGQAPKKGLFMPEHIPVLPDTFYHNLGGLSFAEVAFKVGWALFRNDLELKDLQHIVDDALNFDMPVVPVDGNIYALEQFHGPTLAFKDVGARFMARLSAHFLGKNDSEVTVLVATSGDTGSAVANGFLGVPGIKVVILYPSGKVSKIQEQQLTTLGQNITALEVDGTFDDCQALVKQAFVDEDLNDKITLTSANSINIARLIPQSFYYHYAWAQVQQMHPGKQVVFSVPSGNFGNLTAGLIAQRMGLPVKHFVAATNANNVVPEYLTSGKYSPRPSVATISNAMDVGNPSNFARMMDLYDNNLQAIQQNITGYNYTDAQTRETMKAVYQSKGYLLDPHGAVAYRALKEYLGNDTETIGVFLETAHPAKFKDVVEETLGMPIPIPQPLQQSLQLPKKAVNMGNSYPELRDWLLGA